MKLILTGVAAAALLASAGSVAQAQIAYTNSVLLGCYAHSNTSVDTPSNAVGQNTVGTFCFDGNGNLVGTSGTPGLSGHVSSTDGVVKTKTDQTATYSVTNTPGDGMGTIVEKCGTYTFSVAHVNTQGVAQSFRFILTKSTGKCTGGPTMVGGSAEYQGPLN
jgi:hypothetical protein